MKSARTTKWASNVMYGAAGFFVLGGVVLGATQSNASNPLYRLDVFDNF